MWVQVSPRHATLVTLLVFGKRFVGYELGASVLVSVRTLFLGMFGCDNSRDVVQCQSILVSECQLGYRLPIGVFLLNNLEPVAPRVCAVTARGARSSASPLRSVDDSRRTRLLVCGR